MSTLSVLSPKPPSPVSLQVSAVRSAPCHPLPGIYSLWLSSSVVNLVNLHSAVRLKYHGAWAETLLGLVLLFPLKLLPLRGVVFLSTLAAAIWGMIQHQDPSIYSLSSLPKASIPSLSSGVSSPLCTPPLPEPRVSSCK